MVPSSRKIRPYRVPSGTCIRCKTIHKRWNNPSACTNQCQWCEEAGQAHGQHEGKICNKVTGPEKINWTKSDRKLAFKGKKTSKRSRRKARKAQKAQNEEKEAEEEAEEEMDEDEEEEEEEEEEAEEEPAEEERHELGDEGMEEDEFGENRPYHEIVRDNEELQGALCLKDAEIYELQQEGNEARMVFYEYGYRKGKLELLGKLIKQQEENKELKKQLAELKKGE